MIVDTSALMAILFGEPDAPQLMETLAGAPNRSMSAVSLFEASLVAVQRQELAGLADLHELIRLFSIDIVPFSQRHADLALDAFMRFGKGRHPARLNLGDCCSYALAQDLGQPLLFKGNDFTLTDIAPALPA